ncbi:hypothetical protein BDZ89DRAFT_1140261 [Hymenopellis radicata]|nr:hypothetical protein BDZ89DRAFT_1140261 [Hymenopellis radicata]
MLNPPVQYLPPEILSYILSLTFEKPFHIFRSRMPWLLGQVCRHWRAVAWQNPSLWHSFLGEDFSRKAFHGPILEEVLNRSGKSPLEVSLVDLMPRRASILAQHASRLSELRLACGFEHFDQDSEPFYFDLASKAPRLTHVVLDATWDTATIIISLTSYPNARTLCPFTDSSRENAHIDGELEHRRRTPPAICVFPRLTFLAICGPLTVLSYMQCPALQTFALPGFSQCTRFIETDLVHFPCVRDQIAMHPTGVAPHPRGRSEQSNNIPTASARVSQLGIACPESGD